jgi:hypothetical protein
MVAGGDSRALDVKEAAVQSTELSTRNRPKVNVAAGGIQAPKLPFTIVIFELRVT